MNEVRITLVSRKTILSGTASILAQSGILTYHSYILTTTKRHVESGLPCYAPAARVTSVFEFVTLKEDTAGISAGPNPSVRAMERYSIGSASISTLKTGNKLSSTLRRDNALRVRVAGPLTLLDSTTGLQRCSGFMALIRAANRQQLKNIWSSSTPTIASLSRKPFGRCLQKVEVSISRNASCGRMERFVAYVALAVRRLMLDRSRSLSVRGSTSPSTRS